MTVTHATESIGTSYVLGTEQDELDRLKFQHGVWRNTVLNTWRDLGIGAGSQVVDLGAGPGYASLDLSDIVGPEGHVYAIERSKNFTGALHRTIIEENRRNISVIEADLVTSDLPLIQADMTWSRWVCSFLNNPDALIARLPKLLRPGGVAVFYEYVQYQTWQFLPAEPLLEEFTERVIHDWKQASGETDVAPRVVSSLRKHGFQIQHAKPHVFAAKAGEPFFAWSTYYMRVNSQRSLAEGKITAEWADRFMNLVSAAERDPQKVMVTPMVLEIVATCPDTVQGTF